VDETFIKADPKIVSHISTISFNVAKQER